MINIKKMKFNYKADNIRINLDDIINNYLFLRINIPHHQENPMNLKLINLHGLSYTLSDRCFKYSRSPLI